MIEINELRRLAQAATPGPWKMLPVGDGRQKFAVADSEFLSILTVTDEGGATFGTVYDDADAKFIAAANPAAINELLDRLEEAESDALEQARLNGMGASREAALMAKLEAAERDRATFIMEIGNLCTKVEALREQLSKQRSLSQAAQHLAEVAQRRADALRAKVDAMEKQEPVGLFARIDGDGPLMECKHADISRAPLYLAPGAQPAPSVPVDLITDYLVSISAHVAHQEEPQAQAEIGELLRMLASAPEAKP